MKKITGIIVLTIISNVLFSQTMKIYQKGKVKVEIPTAKIDSMKFSTYPTCAGEPTVTDYDGNVYHTVTIGSQCWMRENLKVTHFNNGDTIPDGTGKGNISGQTIPYMFNINDDSNNTATYGKYYTFYTVVDSNNLCPTGWHVPSKYDWNILTAQLGPASTDGAAMKEAGIIHWYTPNTGATNSSGFTALPAQMRWSSNSFISTGTTAYFWSSDSYIGYPSYAWYIAVGSSSTDMVMNIISYDENAMSVRCIKN